MESLAGYYYLIQTYREMIKYNANIQTNRDVYKLKNPRRDGEESGILFHFGGVNGVGVFIETAGYVAEGSGDLAVFFSRERALLVVDTIAMELLGKPALRFFEVLAGKFRYVDQTVEFEECDPGCL